MDSKESSRAILFVLNRKTSGQPSCKSWSSDRKSHALELCCMELSHMWISSHMAGNIALEKEGSQRCLESMLTKRIRGSYTFLSNSVKAADT